ncbi:MAG: ABC transporter permease [Chloroflexi bacterium]|nr:ABC transporter permease [Chloroflexota bacterium]
MKIPSFQQITFRHPYLFSLALLITALAVNLALQENLFARSTLNSNMRIFLPAVLLAAGQAVVILGGGIDISVGSIVSIINALLATQLGPDAPPERAALFLGLALLAGMGAGAVNGLFVAYLRLQPIITTFATGFLYAGLALFILPRPGGGIPRSLSAFYRDTTPLGLPLTFFIIAAVLLIWFLIRQTRYGRYLFAVGGKAEAAYQTGVPVNEVRFTTYVISGLMAALSGIAITLLTGAGNAAIGDGMTLPSITAVVIGGTALSGGVGGVAGAIFGAIILGLIHNIISFANVDLWWQTFVNAAIIVLALAAPGIIRLIRRRGE